MKRSVVVGRTYGLNLVLSDEGDSYFMCRCVGCGLERRVWHYNVLRSYGCRRCSQRNLEVPPARDPVTGRATKEYVAWSGMVARTGYSSPSMRERYGDSAYAEMEVDPEWIGPGGFAPFYEELGPAPSSDHVLDRKDNSRGYVRGNVRWATASESNRNKSNTHWLTAFGQTKPLIEWADDLGVTDVAIRQRIEKLGWSVEEAVSIPSSANRPVNDEYYMAIAGRVAKRGTCLRRMVGCVLVDEHYRVIATAYNSVPTGVVNCTSSPCPGAGLKSGEGLHLCIAKHAEELAMIKCGDVYKIYTCYSTSAPCIHCVRRLLDSSCKRIVYAETYPHMKEAQALWKGEWVEI